MKWSFINDGIFESHKSPVEREKSPYIYIYIYIYIYRERERERERERVNFERMSCKTYVLPPKS